jgi:hypothetical protein
MATPAPITEWRTPFDENERRYMSVMSRLQVLKDALGIDKLPNELAPAAYVLQEASTRGSISTKISLTGTTATSTPRRLWRRNHEQGHG